MSVQEGNRLRITAVMEHSAGIEINNVFELLCSAKGTDSDGDIMGELADWLDGAYTWPIGHFHNSVSFTEVRGFNVSRNEPLPTVSWPVLTAGTGGGEFAPHAVAAMLVFRTGIARVLGRKFMGILTEGAITDGGLVGGAISDLISFGIAIVSGPSLMAGGTACQFRIFDKNGVARTISTFFVASVLAYQRRRKPGRGA